MVWLRLDAGNAGAAVPYALGFHFFSHFLWLWWFPLSSYLVEPGEARKKVMGICIVLGVFCGTLVYAFMLLHSEWMSVATRQHSIYYNFSVPFKGPFPLPLKAAALYALIVLVPLLTSSHRQIQIFGILIALSSLLASEAYGFAYVSVWCFFAALLSLYLVYMIRGLARDQATIRGSR